MGCGRVDRGACPGESTPFTKVWISMRESLSDRLPARRPASLAAFGLCRRRRRLTISVHPQIGFSGWIKYCLYSSPRIGFHSTLMGSTRWWSRSSCMREHGRGEGAEGYQSNQSSARLSRLPFPPPPHTGLCHRPEKFLVTLVLSSLTTLVFVALSQSHPSLEHSQSVLS